MNLKRVLFSAALIAMFASSAFAFPSGLGLNQNLSMGPTDTLNMTDASGIVPNTPDTAGVQALVTAAFDGGSWDLPGITSSVAAGNSLYSLAVASGPDYQGSTGNSTLFGAALPTDGIDTTTVTGGTVILFTYAGDTNMDGNVTADDYGPIDDAIYAFNHHQTPPVASWVAGDNNMDGAVTSDDYGPIDDAIYAFNHGHGYTGLYPSGTAGAGSFNAVPEPSTILLGLMCIASLFVYRKLGK